jgi:hypothetical protein
MLNNDLVRLRQCDYRAVSVAWLRPDLSNEIAYLLLPFLSVNRAHAGLTFLERGGRAADGRR